MECREFLAFGRIEFYEDEEWAVANFYVERGRDDDRLGGDEEVEW